MLEHWIFTVSLGALWMLDVGFENLGIEIGNATRFRAEGVDFFRAVFLTTTDSGVRAG